MQPRFLSANGLQFGLLEAGPQDGELVLCAHGFPDTAWSFSPLLEHLGRAGYRAVAPFMRGYLPTAVPSNGDYRVTTLARDLIALIDELGQLRPSWSAMTGVLWRPMSQRQCGLTGCGV